VKGKIDCIVCQIINFIIPSYFIDMLRTRFLIKGGMNMMHWGNVSGMGFGGFGFGWIFMILFWALVITGIVYLFKEFFRDKNVAVIMDSAEGILKKRYAAGEITKDQYNEKMEVLKHDAHLKT
jgi:putative membrane protein